MRNWAVVYLLLVASRGPAAAYPGEGGFARRGRNSEHLQQHLERQARLGQYGLTATAKYPHVLVGLNSFTLDKYTLIKKGHLARLFDLRLLQPLMMRLRNPHMRLLYLSRTPIDPRILEYNFSFLKRAKRPKERFKNIFLRTRKEDLGRNDGRPTVEQFRERLDLLDQIYDWVGPDAPLATLISYTVKESEAALTEATGLAYYGAPPTISEGLSGKRAGQELFDAADVLRPPSTSLVRSRSQLAEEMASMLLDEPLMRDNPSYRRFVLKHDQGFSGAGNGDSDWRHLPRDLSTLTVETLANQIKGELPRQTVLDRAETWGTYEAQFAKQGVLAELDVRLPGQATPSPSGVVEISPVHHLAPEELVRVIGLHDQILDAGGRRFEGCASPVDAQYRSQLRTAILSVGEVLRTRGMHGFFGVDFVWNSELKALYAVDPNIRLTASTPPPLSSAALIDGVIDGNSGVLCNRSGQARYYLSTEEIALPAATMSLDKVLNLANRRGVRLDQKSGIGTFFNTLNAVEEPVHDAGHGAEEVFVGYTSLDRDRAHVRARFDFIHEELLKLAR